MLVFPHQLIYNEDRRWSHGCISFEENENQIKSKWILQTTFIFTSNWWAQIHFEDIKYKLVMVQCVHRNIGILTIHTYAIEIKKPMNLNDTSKMKINGNVKWDFLRFESM